jgi:hypothetical protein
MKQNPGIESNVLYGGLTGVSIPTASFDLGEGVELRQTYAHLFSANMMAFAKPRSGGPHPAPWKAARGGFAYDIEVEIRAPQHTSLGKSFDAKETIWWIAALLRVASVPYMAVPVISNRSFQDIPAMDEEPTLIPLETHPRMLAPGSDSPSTLSPETLTWVAENWIPAGHLLNSNPRFYAAFKSFDAAMIRGQTSASMLALWGGLEQLFAPSPGELRFRTAALLSAYLENPGASRVKLYKEILKLYNERSKAAHTGNAVDTGPLLSTYVIMRNALVRIIDQGRVPTQEDLELGLLLGSDAAELGQTTVGENDA